MKRGTDQPGSKKINGEMFAVQYIIRRFRRELAGRKREEKRGGRPAVWF